MPYIVNNIESDTDLHANVCRCVLLCSLCCGSDLQRPASDSCVAVSDLLAEHLREIRALRQRLEESIQTNEGLRLQLERRLAEVERDPGTLSVTLDPAAG